MTKRPRPEIPAEFDRVRDLAQRVIEPIKPVDERIQADQSYLSAGKRARGVGELPPPYLIYFLLVELLGFRDLGRFEKVAWSIPFEFEGKGFLVEHRKLGIGIFMQDDGDVEAARRIAVRLQKGVKAAQRYFRWKAEQAVAASKFNVTNNARELFRRYEFLKERYDAAVDEATRRKDEVIQTDFENGTSYRYPYFELIQEARWLAMAAVDAFFSWTEHIFVLLAILNGDVPDGREFEILSRSEWSVKFKRALDITDRAAKILFDQLSDIRREQRNRLAHGTFGKDGETLHFHSSAGAVPVMLDVTTASGFSLGEGLTFDPKQTFEAIDRFLVHIWDGPRRPAQIYIQENALPLIMTMAANGMYRNAMTSVEEMEEFVEHLTGQIDNAANMDW